ncbi:MAG TPA: ATP/GTP-binding protein [Chitinophagaceae bacterium]|jgi:hypothetical protein|nr:ATP/GTP-binding protein [Chitinophagaceae bacterium]
MKRLLLLSFACAALQAGAQHQLEKLWESDTTLALPESVLPDMANKVLYVSIIDGAPWGADGKGGIAKLDLNGKILKANWVTGLHAPKGMGVYNGKMYVADLSEVAVIDIASGKVDGRIKIAGAEMLNDITVDDKGVVYVSDSKSGKVHRIEKGVPAEYLSGFNGLNGLKSVGRDLYILTAKEVYRADSPKNVVKFSEIEQGGDGIEPVGNGDFIGSTWAGYLHYITADGKSQILLDTHEQKINTADIGYDPATRIIYVPTFFKKSVIAYRLK